MEKIISDRELRILVKPYMGKSISRAWQGYGSALFLEIGNLTDNKGELTVMIEWSWRVENNNNIWFGSWSEPEKISELIPKLAGYTLIDVSVFARLPELSIRLSKEVWVNSFSTVEDDPVWALLFSNSKIYSQKGRLIQKTN